MPKEPIDADDYEALESELELAEKQLLILSQMAANQTSLYHRPSNERLSLGIGCGVSLVRMMSLCTHTETIGGPTPSLRINRGVSGHAIYGPYLKLDKGTYEIAVSAEAEGSAVPGRTSSAIQIQVVKVTSDEMDTQEALRATGATKSLHLQFEVQDVEQVYEFRVSTDGKKTCTIKRLDIWRVE